MINTTKQTYEAPMLVEFGRIEELTKGRLPAGAQDQPQGPVINGTGSGTIGVPNLDLP